MVDGTWHFERKSDGYLTKQQFESLYDRLGKFLHADNPWGKKKGTQNLVTDLPGVITGVQGLLEWHFTVIRTPQFQGVWVVEASRSSAPRIVVGKADVNFVVQ